MLTSQNSQGTITLSVEKTGFKTQFCHHDSFALGKSLQIPVSEVQFLESWISCSMPVLLDIIDSQESKVDGYCLHVASEFHLTVCPLRVAEQKLLFPNVANLPTYY